MNRLPQGGLIDRDQALDFTFNGQAMTGRRGDTLASALLANNVKLVGRSFKYHRPRGVLSAGPEEPNALLTLGQGATTEPNTRATVTELRAGLQARSQNHLGTLKHDLMAVNDWAAPFLSAGFYYKTFMWPKAFWERVYEPLIRRAAGLGALSGEPDTRLYDKGFLHCDLLVIGAGPAGLMAALAAGEAGLRVLLVEQDFELGGSLLRRPTRIDGQASGDWIQQTVQHLEALENVSIKTRSSVFGTYDHGTYGMLETCPDAPAGKPEQILWRVYSKHAVLATGATERSIAFGNNDRPGVMLAGAVETYLNRFAVATGQSMIGFGASPALLEPLAEAASAAGIDFRILGAQEQVVDVKGGQALRAVRTSSGRTLDCDLLAVAGGWNPNVHLTAHHRCRPVWDDARFAFVPGEDLPAGQRPIGACAGHFDLKAAFDTALKAVEAVAKAMTLEPTGRQAPSVPAPAAADRNPAPVWLVEGSQGRAWVDLQNDVTTKDIRLAHQEGFVSVEHLKRYTTLGMATDQGKTSNVLGLALMADSAGTSIQQTGTTMFRPPFQPVALGAFAGRSRGMHFKPTRLPPTHAWAERQKAVFVETGNWLRAQWYPQAGETHWRQSVDREVAATRGGVGLCDVTTLGKIDIQGRDAATFLNRVYANAFAKLAVGKVRYGLMLREDGIVKDDGTTARFSDTHFVMTTTTANAVSVFRHMEFCRQCLWPELDVHLISTTDQWAQIAVAGPQSRRLLERVVDADFDISNEAFPFMACGELTVCGGVRARLFRISFSGEQAYELAVPARYGEALMERLMAQGADLGVTPYGTEALGVMRIEKGHVAGNELNGQTTALELGLGGLVSGKKDSIGRVMSERAGLNKEDGLRLVGLRPVAAEDSLSAGAHFTEKNAAATAENDLGYMTSVAYSPSLGGSIGLGLIKNGLSRLSDRVWAVDLVRNARVEVEIVSPHFLDPEGERLRG